MAESIETREDAISQAIQEFRDGHYLYASQAAAAYGIPPTTFRERLRGASSLFERPVNNKALSETQEQTLFDYIARLDRIGMSPTIKMLESSANFILRADQRRVGINWAHNLVKRNQNLFVRKQKPLASQRKEAQCVQTLQRHFERFITAAQGIGLLSHDLYNMDETGFRIGCGKANTVVTMESRRKLVITDADNRDYISSIECISAGGFALSFFLICAGVWVLEKWCLENALSNDTAITTSETGYFNDEIAMDWLRHFDTHINARRKGAWRMLVMDGYGSHMTTEFLDYAEAHNIRLFTFPPHTTHLTQPLDVGVFQPYKHWHSQGLNHAMRCGQIEFTKLDFFHLFSQMKANTMTPRIISHA